MWSHWTNSSFKRRTTITTTTTAAFSDRTSPLINKSILLRYYENYFSSLPFECFQASKESLTQSTRGMYSMLLQIFRWVVIAKLRDLTSVNPAVHWLILLGPWMKSRKTYDCAICFNWRRVDILTYIKPIYWVPHWTC